MTDARIKRLYDCSGQKKRLIGSLVTIKSIATILLILRDLSCSNRGAFSMSHRPALSAQEVVNERTILCERKFVLVPLALYGIATGVGQGLKFNELEVVTISVDAAFRKKISDARAELRINLNCPTQEVSNPTSGPLTLNLTNYLCILVQSNINYVLDTSVSSRVCSGAVPFVIKPGSATVNICPGGADIKCSRVDLEQIVGASVIASQNILLSHGVKPSTSTSINTLDIVPSANVCTDNMFSSSWPSNNDRYPGCLYKILDSEASSCARDGCPIVCSGHINNGFSLCDEE